MWALLLSGLGCRPEPAPGPDGAPPPPPVVTSTGATSTGATGDTGSLGDTASTGIDPTVPCLPLGATLSGVELLPSARITAPLGAVDAALIVPPHGSDPSAILLFEPGVIVPGVPACRDNAVEDVKVGDISGYLREGRANLSVAGDVDLDGHLDVWVAESLVYGPLAGALDPAASPTAVTEAGWALMIGGLDADEDGVVDLICAIERGGSGFVTFGPLFGPIYPPYDAGFDPASQTHIWGGSWATALIPDHRGPGTWAFALGRPGYDYEWTTVYDLPMPRGARLDPVATVWDGADWSSFVSLRGTGDVDGDGFGDAIFGSDREHLSLARGPFDGDVIDPPVIRFDGGIPAYPAGDVNGDGLGDLIVTRPDGRYGVALSPHARPIAGADAVILGEVTGFETVEHGDLDGDGLEDLVILDDGPDAIASGVRIWFGADVVANQ